MTTSATAESHTSGDWQDVAVVIPCHNEESAIANVVTSFQMALPGCRVIVIDNRSTDATAIEAAEAGAHVIAENRLGKGSALLRGFQALANEQYVVMVDGDGTYDASAAQQLVGVCRTRADMVVATRLEQFADGAFPTLHGLGNRAFVMIVRLLFGASTRDLFSGYRVFRRDLIDALPLISHGFSIDAEISLQAIERGYLVEEIAIPYASRTGNSQSKLRTIPDGYRILLVVLAMFRDYRPLTCFGLIGGMFLAAGLLAGSFPIIEFAETGLVKRLPLAVLAVGLVLLSAVSFVSGVVLSSVQRRADELRASMLAMGRRPASTSY